MHKPARSKGDTLNVSLSPLLTAGSRHMNETRLETRIADLARHFISDLKALDRKILFALVYAAIGLTCINFL